MTDDSDGPELPIKFGPKLKFVGTTGQVEPIDEAVSNRRYWETTKLVVAGRGIVVVLGEDAEEVNRAVLSCKSLGDGALLALGFGDGLHWRRAEEAVRYLEKAEPTVVVRADGSMFTVTRQLIHTQNPSVLDLLTFESAKDVRERVLVVRSKAGGGSGAVENLTEDQAQMFYDAYAVGIQHVSEILRAHGLW